MTEREWETLRAELVKQFDEDMAQQTLLELLEEQQKGVKIVNPLHWCRMRAKSRRLDGLRKEIAEREGKEALTVFGITMPTMTRTDRQRVSARGRRAKKKVA